MTPRLKPQLVKEWSHTRNIGINIETIAPFSLTTYWWECNLGHVWEATVFSRSKGASCLYCSNRLLLVGFNDIQTLHPKLSKLWSIEKNNGLLPSQFLTVVSSSHWWILSCGHEVYTTLNSRLRNKGCGICSGRQVVKNINDLLTTHPKLASQWHPTKNGGLKPENVTAGSRSKAWWQCDQDSSHEWETTIAARTSKENRNCPICSNRKVVRTINDLATTNPLLANQWHPTKNGNLKPEDVVGGSRAKVWWLCENKHSWLVSVGSRTSGSGCPVCSNLILLKGFNDLATTHPILAKEWDFKKNDILPSQVSKGIRKRVWWICPIGHSWEGSIDTRVAGVATCPICYTKNSSSKGETEIYEFLRLHGLEVVRRNRSMLNGKELDIYIPSHNFGVEFNGVYWHSEASGRNKNYHYDKWFAAREAGIQLIQIWEDDWTRNKEFIKRSLAHKLGLRISLNLYARKTHVVTVNITETKVFFEKNHIQGYASGSYYIGLKDDSNQIVAAMILKKSPNQFLEIVRYATNNTVVGGFTKLLSYAEKNYYFDSFVTFADHCISDGGLYKNNGFVADKEIAPDYMYLVNNKRVHKFNYRLKRFKEDSGLLWEEGLTEKELAKLNGLIRIWDAGKTRWVKRITS